jgi:hypothetical protein
MLRRVPASRTRRGLAATIATALACSAAVASCVDDLDTNQSADDAAGSSGDDGAPAQDAAVGEPGVPDVPTEEAPLDGAAEDAVVDAVRPDAAADSAAVDGADDAKGVDARAESAVDAGVVFHGETQYLYKTGGTITLDLPPASAVGDVLVAALLFGNVSAPGGATVTQPSGWTELCQAAAPPDNAAVLVYWAVNTASLTWPAQWLIEGGNGGGNVGVAWLSAYGGVDTSTSPASSAQVSQSPDNGVSWPSPALSSGTSAGSVVVVTFGAWARNPDGGAALPTWSLPAPWITRSTDLGYQRRSGIVGDLHEAQAITSTAVTARVSGPFLPQYVVSAILALKPM